MSLRDFVPGGFPLPASPIYDGMNGLSDFVPAQFPLPHGPISYPAVDGSLPKAPALTQADLAPLPAADSPCSGAGMGCGCASCGGGMGAIDFANLIPGSTFGISNTYLAGGVVLALIVFSSMSGGGRRRRNPRRRR